MENGNNETMEARQGITNEEYFQGTLRKSGGPFGVHGGRRWTEKYKALVRGYFLTEGRCSVVATAEHFGEAGSSVSKIVRDVNPNKRSFSSSKPKKTIVPSDRLPERQVLAQRLSIAEAIGSTAGVDAETELLNAIIRLTDDYKTRCRAELLAELLKKLGA
jgi:hypothetical protein